MNKIRQTLLAAATFTASSLLAGAAFGINLLTLSNLHLEKEGTPVYFHCQYTPGTAGEDLDDVKITLQNHDVLISGFDSDGQKTASATYWNQHYFSAYADESAKYMTNAPADSETSSLAVQPRTGSLSLVSINGGTGTVSCMVGPPPAGLTEDTDSPG